MYIWKFKSCIKFHGHICTHCWSISKSYRRSLFMFTLYIPNIVHRSFTALQCLNCTHSLYVYRKPDCLSTRKVSVEIYVMLDISTLCTLFSDCVYLRLIKTNCYRCVWSTKVASGRDLCVQWPLSSNKLHVFVAACLYLCFRIHQEGNGLR